MQNPLLNSALIRQLFVCGTAPCGNSFSLYGHILYLWQQVRKKIDFRVGRISLQTLAPPFKSVALRLSVNSPLFFRPYCFREIIIPLLRVKVGFDIRWIGSFTSAWHIVNVQWVDNCPAVAFCTFHARLFLHVPEIMEDTGITQASRRRPRNVTWNFESSFLLWARLWQSWKDWCEACSFWRCQPPRAAWSSYIQASSSRCECCILPLGLQFSPQSQ